MSITLITIESLIVIGKCLVEDFSINTTTAWSVVPPGGLQLDLSIWLIVL